MNIFYNASEIASLINKNPYKLQQESIEDVLCRIGKKPNMKDINKFNSITKDELVILLESFRNQSLLKEESYNDLKTTVKNTKQEDVAKISKKMFETVANQSIETKTNNESKVIQKKIETKIDKIMDKKNMKEVKEYVGGFINKQRGIKNENKIIDDYEKIKKTKITNNNDCLYKKHIFSIDDYNFYICGKIDGIEKDELIEIKNRRNRLFTFIPEYEQIQIQIYLQLTDLKKGKLVQNYDGHQSSFNFNINHELWNNIIKELYNVSLYIKDNI